MRNFPIWHDVQACHYKSGKSYGGKDNSGETIYVGTSAKSSHEHCSILTTRRFETDPKHGDCIVFKTSMDGVVLKETWVSEKDKTVVRRRTKLKSIKSL